MLELPFKHGTITENGYMASQSSAGNVSFLFPSSKLRFQNHCLTFQHQSLSTLQKSIPHCAWIIDSGATHVCSDLAMFSHTLPVSNVTVSLPDGVRVPITHIGNVHISDILILHDVLHVPSFHFNLISVSSLLKNNQCSAHFYSDSCFIQEHIQGLMIGKCILIHNLASLHLPTSVDPC